MNEHEIEQMDARYDQFLALREAFADLVATLAEQGILDTGTLNNHWIRSAERLRESGDETAAKALSEFSAEMSVHLEWCDSLGQGHRKRQARIKGRVSKSEK